LRLTELFLRFQENLIYKCCGHGGAVATGLYSIPSRLATFIIVLAGSFSSVLATRDWLVLEIKEMKNHILIKSTFGAFADYSRNNIWVILAKPFILLLFGTKYIDSVPVFQALAARSNSIFIYRSFGIGNYLCNEENRLYWNPGFCSVGGDICT
jgi:hypothetical protein